ncbi:MAG: DUF2490 domain-containing protein [Paludibacteraceae bacterium]|nr:DUF2490 domain-containing protein [Paludibacteraceae bacterium]
MKLKLVLLAICCLTAGSVFATDNHRIPTKSRTITNQIPSEMGTELDMYIEYAPIDQLTLFVGEEFYFSNFLTPDAEKFDASYTSIGLNYAPHKNISFTAAYEFQYLAGNEYRHRVKLMIIPKVQMGDFTLSLRERFHMTYSMTDQTPEWLLRSRLKLDYSIPQKPLTPYVYVEMYNPLQSNPPCWYDMVGYGVGLDWMVDEHNILGFFYEFSHSSNGAQSIASYYHLLGVVFVLGFY